MSLLRPSGLRKQQPKEPATNAAEALFQALHIAILVLVLAWAGHVVVKLIGPMLVPASAPKEPRNWRVTYLAGSVLISLLILDQFLLGRFS